MTTKEQIEQWEEISTALLRSLLPKNATGAIFGHGLSPDVFASLVKRETNKVDKALIKMATSKGKDEVEATVKELSGDTMIALFSRWAHYTQLWKDSSGLQNHWIPPLNEIWRGVLLSMCEDRQVSLNISLTLWPDAPVYPVDD